MANEVYAFLGMTLTGVMLGGAFDLLRALGKSLKIPAAVTDAAFWLTAVVFSASAFVYFSKSVIRGYGVAGGIIGAVLYFLTISPWLTKCFIVIFEFFFKKIRFICKILLTPLRFLYKMLYRRYYSDLKKKKGVIICKNGNKENNSVLRKKA